MGLFGFIKKGIGKVAKAGLSVVTKGLSDKAFKVLKDVGQAKQAQKQAAANQVTLQTYARQAKLTPRVAMTQTPRAVKLALRPMGEKAPAKRKTYRAPKSAGGGEWSSKGMYDIAVAQRSAKKKRKKGAAKVTRAKGTGRKAPKGGLDLKAIAAKWRAAGKPGTWIGYIKANPIKKK
jgi:hypothetical protein